jgi:RNA polymerase primary sigma factor
MHIDCLTPATGLPVGPAGERMLTVDELAREFCVSTKTVRRWRQYGLVSRRFLLAGRRRTGFPQSSVDSFLAHNEERVRRSTRFSRRIDEDRKGIIDHVIIHPDVARIMELPLDYVGNDEFAGLFSEKKDRRILRALPENDPPARKPRAPRGLPAYLASLYEVPLLTREQEPHLFRKMNYLKYKASALRAQLDPIHPAGKLMRQIGKLYDQSVAIKTQIACANLRLVVSVAKRHARPTQDFFELVSDGNMSLLRAVEKFDFSRGNKFSTYATWAIVRNSARTFHETARYRDRFRTSQSEMFSYTEDVRPDPYEQESAQTERESQVKRILDRLDDRDRKIVVARFGLIRGHKPLTLSQVGVAMGVTKERIRQIQARAIDTLRNAANESRIECTA